MNYPWYDFLGIIGVAMIIGSYLFLQLDRLKSSSLGYSLINGLGAVLILISLLFKFNLSAFIIEIFWILISVIGIARYFMNRNKMPAR